MKLNLEAQAFVNKMGTSLSPAVKERLEKIGGTISLEQLQQVLIHTMPSVETEKQHDSAMDRKTATMADHHVGGTRPGFLNEVGKLQTGKGSTNPLGISFYHAPDGELLIEPHDTDTTGLEMQGFTWAGESGMLSLPKASGSDARARGTFDLPFGLGLYVHVDGSVMLDPGTQNTKELEKNGFAWAGESGMLAFPTAPGTYSLLGEMSALVRENGEILLEPGPTDTEHLERQGFTWAGESGMLSLPKAPNAVLSGEYDLPNGFGLYIDGADRVWINPRQQNADALEAAGFRWVGGSGMLEPPL